MLQPYELWIGCTKGVLFHFDVQPYGHLLTDGGGGQPSNATSTFNVSGGGGTTEAAAAALVRDVFPLRRYVVGGGLGGAMTMTTAGSGMGPGQRLAPGQGAPPPPAILPPIQSVAYVTGQAGCFGAPTRLTSKTIMTETTSTSAATRTTTRFNMTMIGSAANDGDDGDDVYGDNRSAAAASFCCDEALVEALVVTQGGRV